MLVLDVHSSCLFQFGLVQRSAALFCIHQINWVNSHNGCLLQLRLTFVALASPVQVLISNGISNRSCGCWYVAAAVVKHGRDVVLVYECCRHYQHCEGELIVIPVYQLIISPACSYMQVMLFSYWRYISLCIANVVLSLWYKLTNTF